MGEIPWRFRNGSEPRVAPMSLLLLFHIQFICEWFSKDVLIFYITPQSFEL